jgi:hypothetical protein
MGIETTSFGSPNESECISAATVSPSVVYAGGGAELWYRQPSATTDSRYIEAAYSYSSSFLEAIAACWLDVLESRPLILWSETMLRSRRRRSGIGS